MTTTILFAPLVGAIIAGFGWRLIGEEAAHLGLDRAAVPRLPAVAGWCS